MKITVKYLFTVFLSVLCVHDAMAGVNCTQDVPAGKYCKTAGTKPDCEPGCYCTGSKTAVGFSIKVAESCSERRNETSLNASGIYFCPQGQWSNGGAKSINDCYVKTYGNGWNNLKCPSGCFCLNNGYFNDFDYSPGDCRESASLKSLSCNNDGTATLSYHGGDTAFVCDRNKYFQNHPNSNPSLLYFLDDFSEIYTGWISAYGIKKDGNIIYFRSGSNSMAMDNIYQCPSSYPASDEGAKTLTECYKYGENGNKIYYRPSNNTNNSGNSNNNTNNNSNGGSDNSNDTGGSTATKTPTDGDTITKPSVVNGNNTNNNYNTSDVQTLVENLQQALNQANGFAQDLKNALNKSGKQPINTEQRLDVSLKPKFDNVTIIDRAAIPQRTKKSLNVPVKKPQSRNAVSKQSALPSIESISVEQPLRDTPKIKRPSKYKGRN